MPIVPSINSSTSSAKKQKQSNKRRERIGFGLLLSGFIALLAYRRRSLSRSGVPATIVTGTTIFGLGGLAWGLTLIYFFISSSLLSHFKEREKASTAADKFSKGSQRDIGQVAANGGVATLLALAYGASDNAPALAELLEAGYVGALATATADTWATELGVLSTTPPRLLTTGAVTAPGTSGGITALGTTAAGAGGLTLGLFFSVLQGKIGAGLPLLSLGSGLAGSLFDSYLGETLQAMYFCPTCGKETERRIHNCGTPTQHLRGLPWMDNDVVNFLATLMGSLVAMVLYLPLLYWRLKTRRSANS